MTRRGESGAVATELTLVTPLFILFLLLVVGLGRTASAHTQVEEAARSAARSASLARSVTTAHADATSTAAASLQDAGASCRTPSVSVDTTAFRPGGWVAVDVTCEMDVSDLSLLPIPAHRAVHARFVSVVDSYRGLS